MNKIIKTEVAIGIILLLTIMTGVFFWLNKKKELKLDTDITLNGRVLYVESGEYISTPCVLSLEGSKNIKVWFCHAIITDSDNSEIKANDLKAGYLLTISGKVMACPPTGEMKPTERLCISASKIIVKDAR